MSEQLAQIEASLKEIAKSSPDARAARVDDLIQLRQQLEEGLQSAATDELTRLFDLQAQYEQLANPLGEQLLKECSLQIAEYLAGKRSLALDQFEEELAQLRQKLNEVVELVPVRQSQPDVRDLQNQLSTLSTRFTSAKRLKGVQESVNALRTRAVRIEPANPDAAIDYFKQARDEVMAALEMEGWETQARDDLLILNDQITRAYDDARNRHAIPTTRQSGEELVQLISYFADLAATSPSRQVTYFLDDRIAANQGTMEVSKALPIARIRLLNLVWRPKLNEYIRAAKEKLGYGTETRNVSAEPGSMAHRPREARAVLELWRDLPGLNDPRVGVDLPVNLRLDIDNVDKVIKDELEALKKAEELAQEIRWEADVREAYKKLAKIKEIYPYYSELESLRAQLVVNGHVQLKARLAEAENLAREAQWRSLGTRLRQIEDLLKREASFEAEFQDPYELLTELYTQVQPLTFSGKQRLKRDAELVLLEELERSYAESYWQGWIELQRRLAELQAGGNVWALRAEAEALCRPDAAVEVLVRLVESAQELEDDPPPNLLANDRTALGSTITKLEAWIGFARARDELAKLQEHTGADLTPENEPDWQSPPDLDVVEKGLIAARRDRGAQQAAVDQRLSTTLGNLKQNDVRASTALESLRRRHTPVTLQELRQVLKDVKVWSKKPTSYRAEFLELGRDARLEFAELLEHEAVRLIAQAEPTWFVRLDITQLEALQREHDELGTRNSLSAMVNGPLEIARAQRLEKTSGASGAAWSLLKEAWEKAQAANAEDPARTQYCQERAKHALMESEFARARNQTNPEDAERILRGLCEDPMLAQATTVWLEHANHCLRAGKALLRSTPGQVGEGRLNYFESARHSYNRAVNLEGINQFATDMGPELAQWEKLAEAEKRIQSLMERNESRLQAANCVDASIIYDDTSGALQASEPRELLDTFWESSRSRARGRFEKELRQAGDVFERLDSIWGILVLFPEDHIAQQRLEDSVTQASAELGHKVDDAVFDDSAQKFLQRAVRGATGQLPKDEDVAWLQLREAQDLVGDVRTLRGALGSLSPELLGNGLSDDVLLSKESHLKDWISQLGDFRAALGPANSLIEDGLQMPEQFATARYILHKGGGSATEIPRVPDGFVSKGHPTYRAADVKLKKFEERRANQERLALRILLCLQYEHAARADDLPRAVSNEEESETLDRFSRELGLTDARTRHADALRNLVQELRQKLQSAAQPIYPVMVARDAIYDMRDAELGEPDDACGLQARLKYRDPDSGRESVGLANIQRVIERKVTQVQLLRRWLMQFDTGTTVAGETVPGVANWKQVKVRICEERDSGPSGLGKAKKECQRVREGDENGMYDQVLALERAARHLSLEEMRRVLEAGMSGTEGTMELCGLARTIDGERVNLAAQMEANIADARQIEQDVDQRLRRYPASRDTFMKAHAQLMKQNKNWGKQLNEFEQAAEEFCSICPKWPDFLNKLEEARKKTGSNFQCPV